MSEEKIKIVVIDDEADLCVFMKAVLEKDGRLEVAATTNPLQAETMIRQVMPQLILTDIVMPDRLGTDIIAALKKDQELKRIPVIVASGKGEMFFDKKKNAFTWSPNNPLAVKARTIIPAARGASAIAEAYGVQDFIAKPFKEEILLQVVSEVIARYKPVQEDEDTRGFV